MPGPVPKPSALRQRRNRVATRATLPSAEQAAKNTVPPLPKRENRSEQWHPMVRAWWSAIWKSPMAAEFLTADRQGGLYVLAELYQRRWSATDTKELVAVVAEIRQQEIRFGLSPIDRRRLQWEIEKGEQASERTETRKARKAVAGKDPREVLKAV